MPLFCFNTLCLQLEDNLVSLSVLGVTQWNSELFYCRPENPKKIHFEAFSPKTNFSALFLTFLLLQHLVHPIGCRSFYFDDHRILTVNFQNVLVHTLKTADKPIFLMFFGTKGIFSPKRDFLFVGTPCASNWEVNSWSSASLVWHKEIPKCSSVDLQSPNNPSFFDVFRPKRHLFSLWMCLFFVSIPCASNWSVIVWVWAPLVWHGEIPQ